MTSFVTTQHLSHISKILGRRTESFLVVSYWGAHAFEKLGLGRCIPEKTTVVCDLMSGACNPMEIKKIQKAGIKALKLEKLHAKVYWTSNAVYIGSANASANGLGFEDDEVNSNSEAGIIVTDKKSLSETKKWIALTVAAATQIRPQDLKIAREAWERRRKSRNSIVSYQVSKSLRFEKPEFFLGKDVTIWMYTEAYSPQTAKRVAQKQKIFGKDIDAYELDYRPRLKPGAIIVDIWIDKKGRPYCEGLFKISEEIETIKVGKYFVVFCKKLRRFDGIKINRGDSIAIERFVKKKYPKLLQQAALGETVDAEKPFRLDRSLDDYLRQ